jgi:hypothetical protein
MIRAVPLALLLVAGRVEALEMPSELHLIPALVLGDDAPQAQEAPALHLKSPWEALGLSALVELPTLFIGPSLGHLYAGEETHFWITGGARLAAFGLLILLEVWGPGIGPLYAVTQPGHLGESFSAYPVAYTVDLLLVLGIIGSAIYDLIDAPYAASRYNARIEAAAAAPHAMAAPPGWMVATF